MIVIPAWNTPKEIERDIPSIAHLRQYWESLNDGMPPERSLVDPEAIKDILPFTMLVDFERNPFRVGYRLAGTKIDEVTGINMTGRYLDEFLVPPFKEGLVQLHETYERTSITGEPHIGTYQWPLPWPVQLKVPFGIFPLTVLGKINQAIVIEQNYKPTPTHVTTTWKEYLSIHESGGPSKLDLANYL